MIAASVWHGRKPQINLSCQTKAQAICRVRRTPASRLLKCSLYRVLFAFTAAALAGFATVPALAQAPAVVLVTPTPAWLAPIDAFPLATPASVGGLVIHQRSATLQPFTVAGECGAFVGQGDGSFEAWTWPVKLLSHLRISAHLQHYSVPIDVNDQSSEITVQPDHTTITFAHAAFTVREILFAAPCTQAGSPGVVAMFQVSSIRPVTLTFSFTPELKRMWPAANFNRPDPEWVAQGNTGYYLLHTDSAELAGAVAMPGTQPGILAPYQERPKDYPLQLVLSYDPARDGSKYFPLLMASGTTRAAAAAPALVAQLSSIGSHLQSAYEGTAQYYQHFFDTRLTAQTPDPRLNQAIKWAEVSIDQLRVRHQSRQYGQETSLVAGLYSSGDSNRPGFGWFFGRDTLYTLYAVDSYGDFNLTREALDFLLKRQRADGKIMHEYSQTAELVDWKHLPYEYAAADSTPLLLMLLRDYALRSGDVAYLQLHWAQIQLAWQFERTHDSDGDGIYDNSQGTGWVESWPPGMPHQEVYLAALDEQASQAYAQLATLAGKPDDGATARAKAVAATLEREYKPSASTGLSGLSGSDVYAFSYNGTKNGTPQLDTTATIYPAIAWWDGTYSLSGSDGMFERWASSEFSTDWGTRDLGEHEALYDPMSYHQGSVWPLFTGWASLAEYRTGRALSGYQHLMQNVDLTWAQDLGAVTELLSGQYFEPLGRSTTHQLWSSAMVLTPALRGLFGIRYNAVTDTLSVDPQLPATWPGATLHHVPVAQGKRVTLVFTRDGSDLTVREEAENGALPKFVGRTTTSEAGADASTNAGTKAGTKAGSDAEGLNTRQIFARNNVLHLPLNGAELGIPAQLPLPGAATAQLKVLQQQIHPHSTTWLLEAQAGSTQTLALRLNGISSIHAEGATLADAMDDSTQAALELDQRAQSSQSFAALAPLAGNALLAPTLPAISSAGASAQHPRLRSKAAYGAPGGPAKLQTLLVQFPAGQGYTQQQVTVRW
jgi:hypothetical protein